MRKTIIYAMLAFGIFAAPARAQHIDPLGEYSDCTVIVCEMPNWYIDPNTCQCVYDNQTDFPVAIRPEAPCEDSIAGGQRSRGGWGPLFRYGFTLARKYGPLVFTGVATLQEANGARLKWQAARENNKQVRLDQFTCALGGGRPNASFSCIRACAAAHIDKYMSELASERIQAGIDGANCVSDNC